MVFFQKFLEFPDGDSRALGQTQGSSESGPCVTALAARGQEASLSYSKVANYPHPTPILATHTHTHTHRHTQTHTHTHTHRHIHTQTHTHKQPQIYTQTHTL